MKPVDRVPYMRSKSLQAKKREMIVEGEFCKLKIDFIVFVEFQEILILLGVMAVCVLSR